MYNTLENKIIPTYYEKDRNGISEKWLRLMKNSIISTGCKYSTARMVCDYTEKLYMPLAELNKKYYKDLSNVANFSEWKTKMYINWEKIKIEQYNNLNNISIDAGNKIDVNCKVTLPDISVENINVEAYAGRISDNGTLENIIIIPMELVQRNDEERQYTFKAKLELTTGGNYGYTFRVLPKHEMILDAKNLDLIKWVTEE